MTASTAKGLSLHEWAVEVDTALAKFWDAQQAAQTRLVSTFDSVHYALDEKAIYRSRYNKSWPTTGPEAEALLREKLASGGIKSWDVSSVERTLANIDSLRGELAAIEEAKEPFEAEFKELRWSRFFLVTNNNGHIHSSMGCGTCFPTTRFAWLPTLSGLTEKEAVAEHGTILCSVCFPSAPVEWTVGKQVDESLYCETSGKPAREFVPEGKTLWPSKKDGKYDPDTVLRPGGRAYYWPGECPGKCGNHGVVVSENTAKFRKHKKKET